MFARYFACAVVVLGTTNAMAVPVWVNQSVANPSDADRHPYHSALYVDGSSGLDVVYTVAETAVPANNYQHRLFNRSFDIATGLVGPRVPLSANMLHNKPLMPVITRSDHSVFPHEFTVAARMTRNQAATLPCPNDEEGLEEIVVNSSTNAVVVARPIADLDSLGNAVCESVGVHAVASAEMVTTDPRTVSSAYTLDVGNDDIFTDVRDGLDIDWPTYQVVPTPPMLVTGGPPVQEHPAIATWNNGGSLRSWIVHEQNNGMVIVLAESGVTTPLRLDDVAFGLVNPNVHNSVLPDIFVRPSVGAGARLDVVWQENFGSPGIPDTLVHATCYDTGGVACTVLGDWTVTLGIEPAGYDPRGPQVLTTRDRTVAVIYLQDAVMGPAEVHVAYNCGSGADAGIWLDSVVDASQGNEFLRLLVADRGDALIVADHVPPARPQIVTMGATQQSHSIAVTYIRQSAIDAYDWSVMVAHTPFSAMCPP